MAQKKKDDLTGPVDERPAEYEQYGVPAEGTEEPYQVGPEKLEDEPEAEKAE